MKLLIIRHGDPDYAVDGLTEKGAREASLLAERLCKENISAVYCSTLGRAKRTAQPTVDRLAIPAQYCEWLREFNYAKIRLPYSDQRNCWDILPEFIAQRPEIYHPDQWRQVDFIKHSDLLQAYDNVCREFDGMLERHGYRRDGVNFRAVKPNHDTVALFCHFGLGSILIAHLLHCSPYSIWQNVCLPTSSVTTFYTEERREGVASFRALGLGDVSHLYAGNEPIAFAARFCECFTDDTRHD